MSVIFVTGGAGYVGSHAVMALAAAGYDVRVYDDLSAGHAEAITVIGAQFPARSIRLTVGDVRDRDAVAAALGESGASAVLHFAGRLSVPESVSDPLGYYSTNIGGTLSVLEAMASLGVRRFVFSSTAATFGEPVRIPIDETHPQQPVNPYGESKLAVERALPHLARAYGLRYIVLRYFNAAGADPSGLIGESHDPEEHLVPAALDAVLAGRPVTIFGADYPTGDGTCVRDFVHVTDLAATHLAALRALESGAPSAAYNLGSERGTSIREVLAAVARVTGRPVAQEIGPRRPGDPARLVASSEMARRELGWAPAFREIDAIVRTAWQWKQAASAGHIRMSEPN